MHYLLMNYLEKYISIIKAMPFQKKAMLGLGLMYRQKNTIIDFDENNENKICNDFMKLIDAGKSCAMFGLASNAQEMKDFTYEIIENNVSDPFELPGMLTQAILIGMLIFLIFALCMMMKIFLSVLASI